MQLAGPFTVNCVVAQPLGLVAVKVTLVPAVMPDTVLPDTVPLLAVTVPFVLNVTE